MPWAVEPEERSDPVAQAKPAPSKVVAVPPEPDVAALELIAPDPDVMALDIGADVMAPEELTPPDAMALDTGAAALEVTGALLAALELLLEVELLADVAALLSLPQALTVRAPAASKATSPVIRVIFTQILRVSSSGKPSAVRPGAPLPRRNSDVKGGGLTIGRAWVNGR